MNSPPPGAQTIRLAPGSGYMDAAASAAYTALARGGSAAYTALARGGSAAHAALAGVAATSGGLSLDLSGGLLIVPSRNAGPALRAALGRAAQAHGVAAFLPPRIETLESWLERAPLATPVESRAARSAGLYRLLKARGWYGGDPPWETVHALLALVDELSLHLSGAGAQDEPRLRRAIEAHYRAGAARIAGEEAQLVLEVWRATCGSVVVGRR